MNSKNGVFIVLVVMCVMCCWTKTIFLMGKTGSGKSTMIAKVFQAIEFVPIGHTPSSMTSTVDIYHSANKSIFAGYEIYDSPGFGDTNGLNDTQILELTEVAFSKLDVNEAYIDGIILVIKTLDNRDASALYITNYMELLGEEMFPSLMIIINRFEYALTTEDAKNKFLELKIHARITTQQMIKNSVNYSNSNLQIPVIDMDCENPSAKDLETLKSTLISLKPYKLRQMNETKKKRVKEIYDEIIANPENYKDEIHKYIVHKNITLEVQEVVRRTVQMPKQVCSDGPEFEVNIGPFASYRSAPACRTINEPMPQDEIVNTQKKQVIPTNEQNVTKVLRNEKFVYEEIAKKKYQEELRDKFLKSNAQNRK